MGRADRRQLVPAGPRGLTLMESVIATAVLAVAITAVFGALAAGTVHASRSADELAANIAVEDLMVRVLADAPHDLEDWDGHEERPGELLDADGTPIAGGVARVGRRVRIERSPRRLEGGPAVDGWAIEIEAFDAGGASLGRGIRWVSDLETSS